MKGNGDDFLRVFNLYQLKSLMFQVDRHRGFRCNPQLQALFGDGNGIG